MWGIFRNRLILLESQGIIGKMNENHSFNVNAFKNIVLGFLCTLN